MKVNIRGGNNEGGDDKGAGVDQEGATTRGGWECPRESPAPLRPTSAGDDGLR
jgi:hypothetical protein